ncbi:hypothetical protein KKH3_18030 [Pectobacterium actinidiae]|nr:hypothetical protein KKH3_18030 [Pectobacterium actinidiae]
MASATAQTDLCIVFSQYRPVFSIFMMGLLAVVKKSTLSL